MSKRIVSIALALILALALAVTAAGAGCPCNIEYRLGPNGVSADKTTDTTAVDTKPAAGNIPKVEGVGGWVFEGWSLTDPAKLKPGQEPELVDPADTRVKGDTVFFAVYEPFHSHYVIGYPSGEFGPDDFITRGSVATIIARAGFEGVSGVRPFDEGTIYENALGFTDVAGHWAESAISYCAMNGVFEGYGDGFFKPDQPITRQEYVAAVVRLARITKRLPSSTDYGAEYLDIDDAGDWVVEDLHIAKAAGWAVGYVEGVNAGKFLPLNEIRRDEAVKIFNGYLRRGVDAQGLKDLKEYVHTGTASNNKENGDNEYMTWPDVPKDHWAYYEIIEAANDHSYDYTGPKADQLPEVWSRCWIDEKWRYHDDANDNGPLTGTGENVDITIPSM